MKNRKILSIFILLIFVIQIFNYTYANSLENENTDSTNSQYFIWPVDDNRISTGFRQNHTGIDFLVKIGTPIYAVKDGIVVNSQFNRSYGNFIIIAHDDGIFSLYAHGSESLVSAGQYVTQGQTIMKSGATGNVTAPLLHFETRTSPGGYSNCVDPVPYLDNTIKNENSETEYDDIIKKATDYIENMPKYYVFDLDRFYDSNYDISEYTREQLEKYIRDVINDNTIEIKVDNLEGGGDYTFFEWALDISVLKDGILYDKIHFGWEDNSQITVFGLITAPSNIENSEKSYIDYAKSIIDNKYKWSVSYNIEKYEELNNNEIVLLDTNSFGTMKYNRNDNIENVYAFILDEMSEIPEPLLIMQYNNTEFSDIINNLPKNYVFDLDRFYDSNYDISEYTREQLEKYIQDVINDNTIEIKVDNLQGGGDYTFFEWALDISVLKDGILYDKIHFGWEDNSQITVFGLITAPSNIENSEKSYIDYAKSIIDNKYKWSVSYNIEKYEKLNNNEIVLLDTNNFGTMKYNKNDNIENVYAFILDEMPEIPEPLLIMKEPYDIGINTYEISGTINSYNSATDDIIVQLYSIENNKIYSQLIANGNNTKFNFYNIQIGEYILKISKKNHVTREYFVTIDNSNINLDTKICLIGDINGDGKVNGKDWNRLYEHINETNEINDYELLCADVNNDGKVNGKDWNRLYEHICEINSLW